METVRIVLMTHTLFCFPIAQEGVEQFEDMGFVMGVERLNPATARLIPIV
jgi:hypothetical protein